MAGKTLLNKAVILWLLFALARADQQNCNKNFPNTCPPGEFCAPPGQSQNPSQFKCRKCPCSVVPDQCMLLSHSQVTCNCTGSGFTGPTCEIDIDECADATLNNCDDNAYCTNTNGSFTCTCNPGYTGNGVECTNIDECAASPGPCDDNASCQDTEGSFTCTCNTGYTGSGAPGDCQNIDECAASPGPCDDNASCQDTDGSFTCTCNTGYTGSGAPGDCHNIDECQAATSPCDSNATCEDTIGSYTCSCNTGFTGDGTPGNCHDINECEGGNPCPVGFTCDNTEPGYCCVV